VTLALRLLAGGRTTRDRLNRDRARYVPDRAVRHGHSWSLKRPTPRRDIVRTVAASPSLTGVAILAVIVLIRTFLSFSLEV